ncbi:CsgG/HfaB family protein [Algicola sagamiensis]|uniref:CsgG/HfaB family protein n=1 Tax=Algicola sagamiensis TaxID=163869 RepID=UPI00035C8E25|nr:CsgG/HfaB family protein [Algicola sagamiensis]
MKSGFSFNKLYPALALLYLSGCSYTFYPGKTPAQITEVTDTQKELHELPKPIGAIPVSVYSFRDQTGQYKPQENGSSFSTAVTQGATSILVQALLESGWFVPVEREGLQNILTERKIIRAANKKQDGNGDLPPLLTAKVLLEGGIISYDSNIRTGGIGLKYYGIGASEQYREDIVTIYLRAIDIRSGRVLLSTSTDKRVLSTEVRSGLFRYVSLKRLAEAEAGFTTNEPMFLCVKQAIEKAISDLIQKGIEKKVWSPDPTHAVQKEKQFKKEKSPVTT